jgi:hypothetical protein
MTTNEPPALREALAREDDVDVSEFFGGESLDEMFVTLSEDEISNLTE